MCPGNWNIYIPWNRDFIGPGFWILHREVSGGTRTGGLWQKRKRGKKTSLFSWTLDFAVGPLFQILRTRHLHAFFLMFPGGHCLLFPESTQCCFVLSCMSYLGWKKPLEADSQSTMCSGRLQSSAFSKSLGFLMGFYGVVFRVWAESTVISCAIHPSGIYPKFPLTNLILLLRWF